MSEPLSSAAPAPAAAKAPPVPSGHELALAWARANPLPAALLGAFVLTLVIFYAAVPLFYLPANHLFITCWQWIWEAWNPETHYEHGKLILPIILFLVWECLPRLRGIRLSPSRIGLVPFALGVGLYLLSARALQPRLAWAGLPFLCLGISLYVAGWRWTRVLLFPILCLFFLIPVPGIDQATVQLQVAATKMANLVCNVIGIKMKAVGTTLIAQDDSFQFQVIGDCSGINSLMAITLMTAIFAHLTQGELKEPRPEDAPRLITVVLARFRKDRVWKRLLLFVASAALSLWIFYRQLINWKKVFLFMASAPVAIVGNVARLTSIMLVAKCFGQNAASAFHEVSAYVVSFPFAFGALCLVNKLLNWGVRTVQ